MDSIDAAAVPFGDGATDDSLDDHEYAPASPYDLAPGWAIDRCSKARAKSAR